MKRIQDKPEWPASWRSAFEYDMLEVYGNKPCGYSEAYGNRRQHTLDMIQHAVPQGASILDVAAAQGNFSLTLAELGYKVTWNDLREELTGYVELKRENGHLEFAPGNVFELRFDGAFDLVLIAEIIEHVAHPDEFLRRVCQLVKPGGYVVMTTPNGEYFLNRLPKFSECKNPSQYEAAQFRPNADGHIFLLHLDEIPMLAAFAGLEVVELTIFTNPLTNGHIKTGQLVKTLPNGWIKSFESFTQSLPLCLRRRMHTAMAVTLQRPMKTKVAQ